MNENDRLLREALARIAEIARFAVDVNGDGDDDGHSGWRDPDDFDPDSDHGGHRHRGTGCTLRSLPKDLLVEAADNAVRINPVNAPSFGLLSGLMADVAADLMDPQRIAVLTSKYWGPQPRRLTVSFMESTPSDLRNRIISHLNAWRRTGSIEFVYTQGTGNVRISRGSGGYWSYLGTDVLLIPRDRPTMNLQGFTMNTSEDEFRRVVRHEAGHTLGFPHEHMRQALVARIDREKAYEYFKRTQGWDRRMVDQQVLTPLDERTILSTPADQDSIMCYQLPGSITRDRRPIRGGRDINQTDYEFAGRIYPRPGRTFVSDHDEEQSRFDSEEIHAVWSQYDLEREGARA